MKEFSDLIDLASSRLGGRALVASDEFFAGKENLLKPGRAIWIADKFTEFGKWMDGWESRRKRVPGHDWCIIALGRPGIIRGVNVDTGHFKGNQPESCTVEAVELDGDPAVDRLLAPETAWTQVTDRTTLNPDSEHLIPVHGAAAGRRWTHVRLNIFPDGGVARFRVHGEVLPDWKSLQGKVVDLGAAENGALVIACNDMHFGSRHNLIMPGRSVNMGDGWETRRKRGLQGGEFDWCVVRLGHRGTIEKVEVDTNHFKGNFPESCELEGCDAGPSTGGGGGGGEAFDPDRQKWVGLLARTKLRASEQHFYEKELLGRGPFTHVRMKIFPDGGVSRLRLWGLAQG
ncbi:MAG: allantoicase [Phycisphaerales bacterium]